MKKSPHRTPITRHEGNEGDVPFKGYRVRIVKCGRIFQNYFPDRKCGGQENALAAAQAHLAQMEEILAIIPPNTSLDKARESGIVSFGSIWEDEVRVFCSVRSKTRSWSIKKYGRNLALSHATAHYIRENAGNPTYEEVIIALNEATKLCATPR